MNDGGWDDPTVEWMLVDVPKGLGLEDFFLPGVGVHLGGDRPVAAFPQNLFAFVLWNVVDGSEGMMQEVLFLDLLVTLVKGRPKDIPNPVVAVEPDSPAGVFVVFADVNHARVVLVIWVGMVFQVGAPLVSSSFCYSGFTAGERDEWE